jgi:hypothetical protein
LINGKTRIGNDSPKSSLPDVFMIRHDDPGVRIGTAKNHVASPLPAENKSGAL